MTHSDENKFQAVGAGFKTPDRAIASCGDVSCEMLVDPIPRPTPDPITVAYKPKKREVVLVGNNKPNAYQILQSVQRMLRKRGIPVQDEIRMKPNASVPMPDALIGEMAAEDGLIVCGIND